MSGWEGQERRDHGDHDILIRIEESVKHWKKDFADHEILDNKRFDGLFKRTGNLQKFQWLLAGGFVILNLILVVFGKYILKAVGG